MKKKKKLIKATPAQPASAVKQEAPEGGPVVPKKKKKKPIPGAAPPSDGGAAGGIADPKIKQEEAPAPELGADGTEAAKKRQRLKLKSQAAADVGVSGSAASPSPPNEAATAPAAPGSPTKASKPPRQLSVRCIDVGDSQRSVLRSPRFGGAPAAGPRNQPQLQSLADDVLKARAEAAPNFAWSPRDSTAAVPPPLAAAMVRYAEAVMQSNTGNNTGIADFFLSPLQGLELGKVNTKVSGASLPRGRPTTAG